MRAWLAVDAGRVRFVAGATMLPAAVAAVRLVARRRPARAEVRSSCQPARRLWVRTKNGHYFPNPRLQLRAGDDGWQPVYERLALDWIDRGCGREIDHRPRAAESIQWLRESLERALRGEPPPEEPGAQLF